MRLDICIDYLHHAVRSPPTSALYISEKSAPQKIILQISNSKFARKWEYDCIGIYKRDMFLSSEFVTGSLPFIIYWYLNITFACFVVPIM